MKYIIVSLAGAADHPAEELGGKTPLEVAKIPNLHSFVKTGRLGQVKLTPERADLQPDTTLLNLLGYDADKYYTGRGPLEAANMELKLEDNEVAFRMNFITESDNVLADPTAGRLSTKEAKALINFLNKKLASDFVRFFPGASYRHIAVMKDSHGYDALSAHTDSPHDMVGERIDQHFPKGPGGELIKKLMFDARLLLQDHEVNQVRVDLMENPANMIWLWGQGPRPKFEKFQELYGLTGAMVSDAEYAKGIARLTGLTVVEADSQPEEMAVHYDKKARQMLEEIKEKDFVCVHLQEADEFSAQGDMRGKISSLEAADFFILSKVKQLLESHQDVRVVVTASHASLWKTRKRIRDWVPFVVTGKNIMPDDSERFAELTAKACDFKIHKTNALIQVLLKPESQMAVTAR